MAKLVANKYYTSKGEAKVNSYMASIPRVLAEKAGFTKDTNIKIRAEKGKIIIEKE